MPYRARGVELGALDVLERPPRRRLGNAFLGLAKLVDERPPGVLDDAIDHDLILGRSVAQGLLSGFRLVGKVHHGPVRIRPCAVRHPSPPWNDR